MTRIGDRRRAEILTAAGTCFARKGFHGTSVADLCTAVALSPGSVYRYFRSKDAIITAMAEDARREWAGAVESLVGPADLVGGLVGLFGEALGSFADPLANAMYAEVTAESLRNPAVAAVVRAGDAETRVALADVIRQAQLAGGVSAALDADATAELIIAMLDGLWWRQAMRPEADPRRHLPGVEALLRRMLLSPPPQRGEGTREGRRTGVK